MIISFPFRCNIRLAMLVGASSPFVNLLKRPAPETAVVFTKQKP